MDKCLTRKMKSHFNQNMSNRIFVGLVKLKIDLVSDKF